MHVYTHIYTIYPYGRFAGNFYFPTLYEDGGNKTS